MLSRSTATADEVELSQSVQNAFATFVKDPGASPAPNWPAYEADVSGNTAVSTLAKIAYHGNVQLDDFVGPIDPSSTVSIGNIYTICGIFIGTPLRTGWSVQGMGPIPGLPPLRYIQVLLAMGRD